MAYRVIGGVRRLLPKGATNGRQTLVSLTGTVAVFRCQMGHRLSHDYSKGPVSSRVDAEALQMLSTYWAGSGGVHGWCQRCENTRTFDIASPSWGRRG